MIVPALVVVPFADSPVAAVALAAGSNAVALVVALPALPALAVAATFAVTDHSSVVQLDRYPGLSQPLSFHLP